MEGAMDQSMHRRRATPSLRRRQLFMAFLLGAAGFLCIGYGRGHHLLMGPRLPLLVGGATVVAVGVALRLIVLLSLPSTGHIEGLVTTGIYAHTRNPIYLSFAVLVVGIALLSRTWIAWPWVALCVLVFWTVARREEPTSCVPTEQPMHAIETTSHAFCRGLDKRV